MSRPGGKGSQSRRQDDQDSLGGSVPYESLPQSSNVVVGPRDTSTSRNTVPSSRSIQAGSFHSLNAAVSRIQPPSSSRGRQLERESSGDSRRIPGFRPSGVAVDSPSDPQPQQEPDIPARSASATPNRPSGTLRLNRAAAASRLSLIPDDPVAESREAREAEGNQVGNASRLSREDMSRTLPRDFNPQTMSRGSQLRGALPLGFKPSRKESDKPLPNPHGGSASNRSSANDLTWEMIPPSVPSPSLGSPGAEIPPTPPLDLPPARFGQGQSSTSTATAAARTYGPSSSNVVSFQSISSLRHRLHSLTTSLSPFPLPVPTSDSIESSIGST